MFQGKDASGNKGNFALRGRTRQQRQQRGKRVPPELRPAGVLLALPQHPAGCPEEVVSLLSARKCMAAALVESQRGEERCLSPAGNLCVFKQEGATRPLAPLADSK